MNLDSKYRPITTKDFVGNEKIVIDINNLLKVGDMPHLMFVGPPGSGKTTMALIIAREYFGKPIGIRNGGGVEDYMTLNASDERGIDTIREIVSLFAKSRSESGLKRIIFLDEADSLTIEAQHALRAIVEKYEDRCMFIFSLNHIEGIKEPALISRCAKFFFKRPNVLQCMELVRKVANEENIIFKEEEMMYDIADYYKGDLRHILNDCLEALRGVEGKITYEHLYKIYEQSGYGVAERVYKSTDPRKTFFDIYRTEAFDTRKFLEDYYELLDNKSLEVSRAFAEVDARLRMYCSEVVQINYLFSLLESAK